MEDKTLSGDGVIPGLTCRLAERIPRRPADNRRRAKSRSVRGVAGWPPRRRAPSRRASSSRRLASPCATSEARSCRASRVACASSRSLRRPRLDAPPDRRHGWSHGQLRLCGLWRAHGSCGEPSPALRVRWRTVRAGRGPSISSGSVDGPAHGAVHWVLFWPENSAEEIGASLVEPARTYCKANRLR